MKIEGCVALVTGGAHRLGRAMALALAGQGARIALHYGSSRVAARQTAAEIAAPGAEVEIFHADLADVAHIERLLAHVEQRFSQLDILINSAAMFEQRALDDITAEEWDSVMAVNLRAPFVASQRAARLMRAAPRQTPALIVNLADLSGVYPWMGYTHHGVSKAGLIHLTRTLARELAPDVRVNAIIPGSILPPPEMDEDSEEWQRIGQRNLLRRVGDPDDIGRSVIFLAESDFITGAVIPVDGGEGLLGPVGH